MKLRLLCFALGLMAVFTPAEAYEDDVHYGLTRWLAEKAGFSPDDSEMIARADVDYDHSAMSAVSLVNHSACKFSKDKTTSEEVQRIHFPGEGKVPGLPSQRKVSPDSAAARSELDAVLLVPTDTPEHRLLKLGKSLHPLQDSWSHQGEPGSPFNFWGGCDPRYSWGHPASRGGWNSHQADLSHRDMASAVAMAKATFAALCDYRSKVLKAGPCRPSFSELSADVIGLLEMNTKVTKAQWFRAQGFTNVQFLYATNVADGGRALGRHEPVRYTERALTAVQNSNPSVLPGTDEAAFIGKFLREWMTQKDLSAVVKEWIALDGYRPELGQGDPRTVEAIAAEAQLKFWRVRDHGSLEQPMEGHDLITRRFSTVPDRLQAGDQPYGSIDEALLPFDETGLPIVTWTSTRRDGEKLLVGAVRLRHAPNDLVIVVAGKVAGRYKVIAINSLVLQ